MINSVSNRGWTYLLHSYFNFISLLLRTSLNRSWEWLNSPPKSQLIVKSHSFNFQFVRLRLHTYSISLLFTLESFWVLFRHISHTQLLKANCCSKLVALSHFYWFLIHQMSTKFQITFISFSTAHSYHSHLSLTHFLTHSQFTLEIRHTLGSYDLFTLADLTHSRLSHFYLLLERTLHTFLSTHFRDTFASLLNPH